MLNNITSIKEALLSQELTFNLKKSKSYLKFLNKSSNIVNILFNSLKAKSPCLKRKYIFLSMNVQRIKNFKFKMLQNILFLTLRFVIIVNAMILLIFLSIIYIIYRLPMLFLHI